MKTSILILTLTICALSVACAGHKAEVKAFLDERSEVVGPMLGKIERSPNEKGIDEARKIFEGKKADLRAKRDALKNVKIGWDLYQILLSADLSDSKAFESVYHQRISELIAQPEFYKLRDEYMDTVRQ